MITGGIDGGSYKPLTDAQVKMLHKASMKVFEEVGMEIHDRRALEILAGAGADVDFAAKRMRASESWIMDILKEGAVPGHLVRAG